VLEHVNAPRSPWSRFALPAAANLLPAFSAVAVALIVVFVGTFAVFRTLDDNGREPESLTAPTANNVAQSAPTATVPGDAVFDVSTSGPEIPTSTSTTGATEVAAIPTVAPADRSQTATEQPTPDPPTEEVTSSEASGDTEPSTTTSALPTSDQATEDEANTNQVDIATGPSERASVTATAVPTEIAIATEEPTSTEVPTEALQAAAIPTEETPEPTATSVPTEVPTERPEPTATSVPTEVLTERPEPTATSVPTEVPTERPEPTATSVPTEVPTETPEPTATSVPTEVPTETPEPTATSVPTEVPTETPEPTATSVPTEVPTETPEPTATSVPTKVPTETPEPTATSVPTEVPTETPEPTATTVPTEVPTETSIPVGSQDDPTSPPIEPSDGTFVSVEDPDGAVPETPQPTDETTTPDDDGDDIVATIIPSADEETATSEAEESNSESGDGDVSPPIEPSDDITPVSESDDDDDSGSDGGNDDADGEVDGIGDGNGGDGGGEDSSGDDEGGDDGNGDPDDDSSGVGGVTAEATMDAGSGGDPPLSEVGVFGDVSSIPGDPGTRLGISAAGELIFSVNPGRVSLEENGLTLSAEPSENGQSVVVCDGGGNCLDATSASATGPHQDTPLGWLNGELIYERIDETAANPLSYHAVRLDPVTGAIAEDRTLGEGGRDIESILRPYPLDGGLLVLAQDAWLFIDANGVESRDSNPYGNGVQLIRIHPANGELSYVADGQLITASLVSPGSPNSQFPFSGTDYDLSPDGSQIVINTGSELQIVGRDGQLDTTIVNPEGLPIGPVVWLNEGIVFVDLSSGELRLVQVGG